MVKGVSSDSLPTLFLLLNAQNSSDNTAMRPIAPKTPPTTGAAVSRGLEDTPAGACDTGWSDVDAGEEFKTVLDGS